MSNGAGGNDGWRPGDSLGLDDDDDQDQHTEIGVAPPVPVPVRPIAVGTMPAGHPSTMAVGTRASSNAASVGVARTMISQTPPTGVSVAPRPAIPQAPAVPQTPVPPVRPSVPLPARTMVSQTPPTGMTAVRADAMPARTMVSETPPAGMITRPPVTNDAMPARTVVSHTPPAGMMISHSPVAAAGIASAAAAIPARTVVSQTGPFHEPAPAAAVAPRTIVSSMPPTARLDGRATPPPPVVAESAFSPAINPEASMSNIELELGSKLGQFELIRELGRGGMGQVFLARDIRLARLVALKFLGQASRALTERFLVEARATARCQHENIVVIYEADEWQGKPYMALEYLEGETLTKLLDDKTLAPSRALEIIVPVVRALARAHEHGIVHCDLKPDNILVTREGIVKVLDFGIARALGTASVDVASGVKDSGISGTMPYMAPEQWGADEIDHRTDLWAVGIILWQMLTGRHPLDPLSQQRLVHAAAHLNQPMPRIGDAMPDCPPALEQIIDRCLAKPKAQRFETARALLDVLEPQLPGRFGRRLAEGDNPYPGMSAFQENDADRFFGRDRDITHMVARMVDQPLVGVVAPSGVGKSSFLRAGVIPALKSSGESWEVFVTRPGRSPLSSLATLLQPIAQTTASSSDLRGSMQEHEALEQRLRTEPGFLGTLLRSRARQKRGRILLFVDQFEELYTLCPDPDERRAYTAVLAGIADDAATPLRVVVSMRSDFLDRAAEDRVFMERLTRGLLFLPPVDHEGMREALLAPIAMAGYRFENDGIVDEMLGSLAGTDGALPLLQFTAAMLWDARDKTRKVLTSSSYEAIGGVAGALATHADHVLAAMSPERQKLARAVFMRLVTVEGTRAIVDVSELTQLSNDPNEVRGLLDQVVAARLLVVQTREEGPVVEIVHESLLTRWPTLRRWLDENSEDSAFLEQLRTAAKQWDSRGRAAGLLWRGEAMEDARTFVRRFKGDLPARERGFLDAVMDLATRATRRKRRLIVGAFVILGGLFAVAIVGMLYIRNAEQEAQAERVAAQHQRTLAQEQKDLADVEATKARAAEAKVQAQLDTVKKAEAERVAAEAAAAQADAKTASVKGELVKAETEVAAVGENLEIANKRLKGALEAAKGETRKAEKASADLEVALAREKEQVKQLKDAMKKLATDLK